MVLVVSIKWYNKEDNMNIKKSISVFMIIILIASSSFTIAFADSNSYSSNGYYSANNID